MVAAVATVGFVALYLLFGVQHTSFLWLVMVIPMLSSMLSFNGSLLPLTMLIAVGESPISLPCSVSVIVLINVFLDTCQGLCEQPPLVLFS
ncbi:hypothetical protein BP422_30060 [Brevibacillus formosus]|uniref:Uncharacterized protein n=1 Tax=Brevibacillus formosus TaxID=54913 RepID=A0A220MQI3_9BACL|nr:hypothetical protein [Brevibacillus formosus]ASJ57386.1 hypothetical protein BP422_30060 [Brevibacillus formosus]